MKQQIIHTDNAPAAIGPYVQATAFDRLIFTSGQLPIDPKTGELVKGGIEEQTQQSILNLKEILSAAGSSLSCVLKTNVYLKNMDDFAAMNKVYSKFFAQEYPARSAVQVAKLPKDALVEIEAVAYRKD
ncbi:MAG: Enamine/imine deaminase [Oscillospiraceae bacterium]|jgi:2-iminobutanoate/2-iminopropanoate deaminase